MNRRIAVLVAAAIVVSPITALAQGGGGGSGGGSGGATGGASSGGATTGATGGATNNGMNSQQTTQSTSKTQTIQDQKNVVTSGTTPPHRKMVRAS